jgi:hydroxyacylglutathione hydrolase
MIYERIKSKIVSHLSYFIGSGNSAFVVDPTRDVQQYLELSKKYGVNIKYIFETHRNEDYVIGSIELAKHTGAEIFHGSWPDFKYGKVVEDGEEFRVGNLKVKVLATPGHTPGCRSYVVTDLETGDDPVLVCTGDTLFIGDSGRTDFGGPENRAKWSALLYESIFEKILPLGDHVLVCPAHGSGSVCGARIANREDSTLGTEKLMNPWLQMSREEFIKEKIEEHHNYAPYFKKMEVYNLEGPPEYGFGPTVEAMSAGQFENHIASGGIVVDTRPPPSFASGYIKSSYNISMSRLGMAGWVLPYDKPILLVLGNQSELKETITGLARIGYDNIMGYLKPSIVSWYLTARPIERLGMMTTPELKGKLDKEDWMVLDVRSIGEYESGHIEGSINIYTGLLPQNLDKIPKDKPVAVICKSGTRSGFGSSILKRYGFENIHNVMGGMTSWSNAGYPMVK